MSDGDGQKPSLCCLVALALNPHVALALNPHVVDDGEEHMSSCDGAER